MWSLIQPGQAPVARPSSAWGEEPAARFADGFRARAVATDPEGVGPLACAQPETWDRPTDIDRGGRYTPRRPRMLITFAGPAGAAIALIACRREPAQYRPRAAISTSLVARNRDNLSVIRGYVKDESVDLRRTKERSRSFGSPASLSTWPDREVWAAPDRLWRERGVNPDRMDQAPRNERERRLRDRRLRSSRQRQPETLEGVRNGWKD
jgi:hypothetical protein